MIAPEILNIIRIPMYFLIGLTFAGLAYSYYFGYKNVHTSNIIRSMVWMFFFLSAYFFYLCFMPVLKITSVRGFDVAAKLLPVFLLPIFVSTYIFFLETFKPQIKPTPKSKITGEELL